MTQEYDLIVIGAGPAGMMAAGRAAQLGARVLLAEQKNRPGRKLLITGKGRCNITNNCDAAEFLAAVRRGQKFLHSAAAAFSPVDTMAFFESHGLPLKTERGRRVFPASDRSADVLAALMGYLSDGQVTLHTAKVREILAEGGAVTGIRTTGEVIRAGAVVLATGGMSYPATGSDGSGYRLAEALGHSIIQPRPSLIPIATAEPWCSELSGLSLRNVTLTLKKGKRTVFSELGEMLFTHFGVSGPLVLSASSHMEGEPGDYKLFIDLKPALDAQKLDKRLLRDFEAGINKDFANSLGGLLPKSMIPVVVRLSGIPGDAKVHQVTKQQRARLGELLKGMELTPVGFRPIEEAVVTSGGVNIKEVNPGTMESKLIKGLYFAGEVLDLDAYTGGFNLQIAFSTGYLAGTHAGGRAQ